MNNKQRGWPEAVEDYIDAYKTKEEAEKALEEMEANENG